MLKFIVSFFNIIAFAFVPTPLTAQWVQTNGPYGSGINAYAVNGAYLFASTTSGLFRSSDNGTSWVNPITDSANLIIQSIAGDGVNLYAGGGAGGVYVSTDMGASWSWVSANLLNGGAVFSLAIHDSNIFAGTEFDGIYRSTDKGTSWVAIDSGLTTTSDIFAIASSGQKLFAGTRYGGVFCSSNNGTSWSATDSGLTEPTVYSLGVNGGILFAGTPYGGIFRSTDSGTTWSQVNAGLPAGFVAVYCFAFVGGNTFASTNFGVFRSTNDGTSWIPVNTSWPTASYVNSFAVIGDKLIAGTNAGAFCSTDNGGTWNPIDSGLDILSFSNILGVGGDLLVGTGGFGLFRSTNYGINWIPANNGLTSPAINELVQSGSVLIAGTDSGLFRSTDNGFHWTADNSGSQSDPLHSAPGGISAALSDSGGLFVAAGGAMPGARIFHSTDNGLSWSVTDSLNYSEVRALVRCGNDLFAAYFYYSDMWPEGGVYRSTDNGVSWANSGSGVPFTYTYALAVRDSTILASSYEGKVFRSTDIGNTWTESDSGLSGFWGDALASNQFGFFAAGSNGVFYSPNDGISWRSVSQGLPGLGVSALGLVDTDLYVTTDHGIWKGSIYEVTAVHRAASVLPQQFRLYQNYPNPFNPTTTIHYELPRAAFVHLAVYNILGQEVRTLVNQIEQPGFKSVAFNAGALTSGVYFYKITTGAFSDVKKMLLIK